MEYTQNYIQSILKYDPDTGVFIWLERPLERFARVQAYKTWNKRFAGKPAGTVNPRGYRMILIDKKPKASHRLAFLYMIGRYPKDQVDHINGMKWDNRWVNIREATQMENSRNTSRPRRNTSGVIGVMWKKEDQKWVSRITVLGDLLHLGSFNNKDDAVEVRKIAEIKYGFHKNHGRDQILPVT